MKKLFLFLALLAWLPTHAQSIPKKIYFLADTNNLDHSNKVIEIGKEGNIMKYFTVFCPCMDKENNFAQFMWIKRKWEIRPKEVAGKPKYPYISFKELTERIAKYKENFDKYYELNIVEPRKIKDQYITWKVEIVPEEKKAN
jgi:hypothetical protein